MPVVHDGSSSVFYPGKLIFFVRGLPYPARYGIYIAIHIPIAAAGTYWFARTLKARQVGATLSAIAFSFSGYVLFQSTNVVYLVSAAWLPFALCSVWLMFRQMKIRWAISTATCCSLMILGGDPQMCYHIGLIMVAFAFWKFMRSRRRHLKASKSAKQLHSPYPKLLSNACLVVSTVLLTAGLAAIQILPSYVWSQRSIRAQLWENQQPRNIYEALSPESTATPGDVRSGLLGTPKQNTHHDHIYQFSQPPWALLELIAPNISGKPFPVHQRWVDGLPGAERMWTPSIYLGCFVFVLALAAFNPFSKIRRYAWLSRIAIFFLVASFGWYGPVWLINELGSNPESQLDLGAPIGGLYWCMVVLLPKYVAFRYPAKLVVLALLAFSVLAGLKLDSVSRTGNTRALMILTGCLIACSIGISLGSTQIASTGVDSNSDLFGPFDLAGCKSGILLSGIASTIVLALCCTFCHLRGRQGTFIVFCICGVEILMMNSWLVPTVSQEVFEPPRWPKREEPIDTPTTIRRNVATPTRGSIVESPRYWNTTSSPQRLSEIVTWQLTSLHPKHHLSSGIHLIGSFYSLEPAQKAFLTADDFEGLYDMQTFDNREYLLETKEEFDGIVQLPLEQSNVNHHWSNCNQLEIQIQPTRLSPTDGRYALNLQPISGWKYSVRDSTNGELLKSVNTIEPQDGSMEITVPEDRDVTVSAKYEPFEFFLGAWLSATSWCAVITLGLTRLRRKILTTIDRSSARPNNPTPRH